MFVKNKKIKPLFSTPNTLILMIFKDLRLEMNIPQKDIASMLNKTTSAWTKIENGQTPLTMDVFLSVCTVLHIQPSSVLNLVDQLISFMSNSGWVFHTSIRESSSDDLLPLVRSYFDSSKSSLRSKIPMSKYNFIFTPKLVPTVVQYCCDPKFRTTIDK